MKDTATQSPPSTDAETSLLEIREAASESRALATRIARSIRCLTPGRILDLNVVVRDNTILLDGRCSSFYSKQLAQTAAMQLACGQQVNNRIEVQ